MDFNFWLIKLRVIQAKDLSYHLFGVQIFYGIQKRLSIFAMGFEDFFFVFFFDEFLFFFWKFF
jgi:hypothetical protein